MHIRQHTVLSRPSAIRQSIPMNIRRRSLEHRRRARKDSAGAYRSIATAALYDTCMTDHTAPSTTSLIYAHCAQTSGVPMYIGEIAKRAGATPKAIRLYESLGLLGRVPRLGAYRLYTEQHVVRVRLIKQAQTLGFKLAEVAPGMRAVQLEPDWRSLADQVELRRIQIAREIVHLQQLDLELQGINEEIRTCAELA